MIRADYALDTAGKTWVKMRNWQSVRLKEVRFTLNLKWFRRLGIIFLDDYIDRTLEFNFSR